MKTPIVIAAFGTTTKALETYSLINQRLIERFPDNEILWSYSSRMVKDWIKKRQDIDLKHPHQVLFELKEKGYTWAVVQSLHLLNGHEFYRLVDESQNCDIRTSIGLPLLSSPEDFNKAITALQDSFPIHEDEALVMVGHGTDHPCWSVYVALNQMLREKLGLKIFTGVVEGYPAKEKIVEEVKKAGFKKVRIIPFMLVAGVHFHEDLAGNEDSWKSAFEKEKIFVTLEKKGLGSYPGIIDIFSKHIQEALDVIP
ncbi:MAG: sirohydrochlorin cobaltochelatase [Desulfobacteraceae bacterium Eth-SRB2]|nr:MAG: sirohydrochlorin cobaltochelatase [Desulfobacteraceae bacterium Eth-SRB2]